MFRHLLIPLDGSALAETALPMAAEIAMKVQAKVTLLHVIEEGAPQSVHGERHLTQPAESTAYLDGIAQQYFPGLTVERHVHSSAIKDVPRSIVDHCKEMGADVIVLSTHGKSGLKSLLFGSIAQHVVQQGTWPVLLTRSRAATDWSAPQVRRVMVLLDRDPAHEQGLCVATEIFLDLDCELELLMVVPTLDTLRGAQGVAGTFLPASTREVLEIAEEEARSYLEAHLNSAALKSPRVSHSVRRGDPVAMITQAAAETKPDIVVLGTHGTAGTTAFWSGSLTPKLIERLSATLLLVPVGGL
jgi:nucleotide-binding universal stress UspA family protein